MNNKKYKVLIVDDEPANQRLLQRALEKEYEVRVADSGEDCITLLADFHPDVYLLDVMMPNGMDGYELCETIRNTHNSNQPLIIFLSALSSLDDKVKGYKVGGDDYITKPLELPILFSKLTLQFERLETAKKTSTEAMNMAMTALTNGSEIGQVNLFLEGLNKSDSFFKVGQEVISLCNAFSLNAAVQLRSDSEVISLSTTGVVNTLEAELMIAARDASRIYTFGRRCLFNFNGATLLVRSMPDDEDKAGRYRDHLASVMNGVEARGRTLHAELMLKSQNESIIVDALKTTHEVLDELMCDFKQSDAKTREILENFNVDINGAFSFLDLDEDSESQIIEVINKYTAVLNEQSSDGLKIDRKFEGVISSLQQILKPSHLDDECIERE